MTPKKIRNWKGNYKNHYWRKGSLLRICTCAMPTLLTKIENRYFVQMAKSFIKLQKLLSSIDLRLDDMFDFG